MKEDLKFLLVQVADGDEKAFRHLFEYFSSKVFVFALKLTHNKTIAEEVVQEVFVKVWNNRHKLPQVDFFPAYLSVVTRNHVFNILKGIAQKEKANSKLSKQARHAHSETEEFVIHNDYQNILTQIVNELPPQQKTAYSLCHGEGLKYEEAAARMNVSTLTVKSHMQTALRTIKTRFGNAIQYFLVIAVSVF